MLKIFYKDSQWWGFEAPEKPKRSRVQEDADFISGATWTTNEWSDYDKAYAETRANALKVLNPEIICEGIIPHEEVGKEYDWPGSYQKLPAPSGNGEIFIALSHPSSAMGYSEGSEVPKLSEERVKEIEEGVNWYRGECVDCAKEKLSLRNEIKKLKDDLNELKK